MKKIILFLILLCIPFHVKADTLLEEAERQKNAAQQFAALMSQCANNNSDYCNEAVHSKISSVTSAIDNLTERAKQQGLDDSIFKELETYSNVLKKSSNPNGTSNIAVGCGDIYGGGIGEWIKNAFNFVKYVGLALVVVLTTMDFLKVVAGEKDDGMKTAFTRFTKRCIALFLLFLAPVLIEFAFNILDGSIQGSDGSVIDVCVDYIK